MQYETFTKLEKQLLEAKLKKSTALADLYLNGRQEGRNETRSYFLLQIITKELEEATSTIYNIETKLKKAGRLGEIDFPEENSFPNILKKQITL